MTTKDKLLKIKLVRRKFGRTPGHRECVEGLGLRRINQTVEVVANSCNLGMINKVKYLLKVEEVK